MRLEFVLDGQNHALDVPVGATLAQVLENLGGVSFSEVCVDGCVLDARLTMAYRVHDCKVNTVGVEVEPPIPALVLDQVATAH